MLSLGPDPAYIFRITHIDNMAWMLRHGMHAQSSSIQDPSFERIGSVELIEKRSRKEVPIPPGGCLGDYVPFYFTPLSIMLYNICTGYGGVRQLAKHEIVFVVSSLQKLSQMGLRFVFTDSHAYGAESEFYSDLDRLDRIDWQVLRSNDFRSDPEDPGKKGRYQAEALAYRHVPVEAFLGVACYDDRAQGRVANDARAAGVTIPIKVMSNWYFQ